MTNKKIRNITLAAMLTALTIIIPIMFTPLRVVLGPYTATITAHVPVIVSMFISAPVAAFVALCSGIGFLISSTPIVALRAASHVFFAFAGAKMIASKKSNIFVTIAVTALIHAVAETLIVYLGCIMGFVATNEFGLGFYTAVTFGGTVAHHCVDFIIALLGIKVLKSANLID